MAVRNESVRLSLDDDFTSGMARAAAATALFKKELNGLDGKRVSRELDDTGRSVDGFDRSVRRSGPEVDRFSGRLRLLADAAVTLGPALVPLGAGAIPVLTGSLMGLGAAAGGIAATVLAFNGLGDALKSMNDYQLEPTAENLQKLRIEQEKLGPAGADFAKYLHSLTPVLRDLQNTAREGIFPGLEDGINAFLERGPQVTRILADLSDGMGDIARDAGEGLSSEAWTPFFNYVETDARPTLEAFAEATGNVALGVANMMVAFAPLSQDFTGGLVDATQAFADWSTGLDENEGFQSFVAYVRENGPRAAEFLGELAQAMAALLEAGALWGSVMLPALTGVLEVFSAIASSDAGPALYAAAAGLLTFNAAAKITAAVGPQLRTTFAGLGGAARGAAAIGLLAASMTDLDEKAKATNTTMLGLSGLLVAGPIGLGVGVLAGSIADIAAANDDLAAATERAQAALDSGDTSAMRSELESLRAEIEETNEAATLTGVVDLWRVTTGAGLVLAGGIDKVGSAWSKLSGEQEAAERTAGDVADAMRGGGDIAGLYAQTIGQTAEQFRAASSAAADFSGALAQLNGWFGKRDAVIAYKDAIHELAKGLDDGFGRKDLSNINAVGQSILQVASQMSSPVKRANFLAEARAQMEQLATNSGPKAAAAIEKVIEKFDRVGLTHPEIEITADDRRARNVIDGVQTDLDILGRSTTEPTINADDAPARDKINGVQGLMRQLSAAKATPGIEVQAGGALGVISNVQRALNNLRDKSITVTVNTRGGVTSGAGGHSADAPGGADGMTVPGKRYPYGDKMLIMAAPGEEIISNRFGQADRFRADRAAGRIPGYADGGTAGSQPGGRGHDGGDTLHLFVAGAWSAAKALKAMETALAKSEKALDRERSKLEELTSRRDSLSSSVTSSLLHDPFGNGLAGFQAQNAADSADSAAMLAALKQLVANGLDPKGALFQALAASGDVTTAQQMATLTSSQLFAEQAAFNQTQSLAGQVGQFAGQQAFGEAIKEQRDATKELRQEVRHLRHEINQMGNKVKDGAEKGTEKGAHKGVTDANEGRNRRVGALTRAGG